MTLKCGTVGLLLVLTACQATPDGTIVLPQAQDSPLAVASPEPIPTPSVSPKTCPSGSHELSGGVCMENAPRPNADPANNNYYGAQWTCSHIAASDPEMTNARICSKSEMTEACVGRDLDPHLIFWTQKTAPVYHDLIGQTDVIDSDTCATTPVSIGARPLPHHGFYCCRD